MIYSAASRYRICGPGLSHLHDAVDDTVIMVLSYDEKSTHHCSDIYRLYTRISAHDITYKTKKYLYSVYYLRVLFCHLKCCVAIVDFLVCSFISKIVIHRIAHDNHDHYMIVLCWPCDAYSKKTLFENHSSYSRRNAKFWCGYDNLWCAHECCYYRNRCNAENSYQHE